MALLMGMFERLRKRFGEDEAERRAASIREWSASVEGATPIERTVPRTVVRVAGVVEGMRVRPRDGVPAVEALVTDGTGTVTAIWLGRRALPGLTLGCRMILEGRFGGDPSSLQIVNPRYEFRGEPRSD